MRSENNLFPSPYNMIHSRVCVGCGCAYCNMWVYYALIEPRLINASQIKSATLKIYWRECRQAIEPESFFFFSYIYYRSYEVFFFLQWTRFNSRKEISKWLIAFPLVSWIVWQCQNDAMYIKGMNSYYISVLELLYEFIESPFYNWLHLCKLCSTA